MKPATINLTLYQGSTFRKNFQWLSGDTPTNLTNCEVRMQIRQDYFTEAVLKQKVAIEWGDRLTFESNNPILLHLASELGISRQELSEIFNLASTL